MNILAKAPQFLISILIMSALVACGGGDSDSGGTGGGGTQTHSVSAIASAGGTISPASRTVTSGQTTTFSVTANTGYSIGSVSGCGGNLNGNTYTTAAITTACTVSATFTINSYNITATAGEGGGISPSSQTVNHGATANFTVTPNEGYSIGSVSGCGGSLTGNTYTTEAITSACTISASFSLNSYTVTATASEGGSISPTSIIVAEGGVTSFDLITEDGFLLSAISGCAGQLMGLIYTTGPINQSCHVSAQFTPQQSVQITVSATILHGSGTVTPEVQLIDIGENAKINIVADQDSYISKVQGCGITRVGDYYETESLTENCEVEIYFSKNEHFLVTTSASTGGLITPTSTDVPANRTILVGVASERGQKLASINGCGLDLGGCPLGSENCIFTTPPIRESCHITAEFSIQNYRVFATTTELGGGTVTPTEQWVNYLDAATVAVNAMDDTELVDVTGCDGSLNGNLYTTAPITEECTIIATFGAETFVIEGIAGEGGWTREKQTVIKGRRASVVFRANSVVDIDGKDEFIFDIDEIKADACDGVIEQTESGWWSFTIAEVLNDCVVNATFKAKEFDITTSVEGYGSISPSEYKLTYFEILDLSLVAESGYQVTTVEGCNGILRDSQYLISAVSADCHVVAKFNQDDHVIFPDIFLDTSIRQALNLPVGEKILKTSLETLTTLEARHNFVPGSGIEDLQGIQYLPKLKRLDLSNNVISNIYPLQYLVNLEELILDWNTVASLSDISLLPLRKLSVFSNKIVELPNLNNTLEDLNIALNQIANGQSLGSLYNLKHLVMSNNPINDASFLHNLTSLQSLDIFATNISEISGLASQPQLRYLNMTRTPVVDIAPLLASGINNADTLLELDYGCLYGGRYSIAENVFKELKNVGVKRFREYDYGAKALGLECPDTTLNTVVSSTAVIENNSLLIGLSPIPRVNIHGTLKFIWM